MYLSTFFWGEGGEWIVRIQWTVNTIELFLFSFWISYSICIMFYGHKEWATSDCEPNNNNNRYASHNQRHTIQNGTQATKFYFRLLIYEHRMIRLMLKTSSLHSLCIQFTQSVLINIIKIKMATKKHQKLLSIDHNTRINRFIWIFRSTQPKWARCRNQNKKNKQIPFKRTLYALVKAIRSGKLEHQSGIQVPA